MGIRFRKGTETDFQKIKSQRKFYKVTDIYIDENGDLFYLVEEMPETGNKKKIDNDKKILYNISIE